MEFYFNSRRWKGFEMMAGLNTTEKSDEELAKSKYKTQYKFSSLRKTSSVLNITNTTEISRKSPMTQ